jgi:hypothetical protein
MRYEKKREKLIPELAARRWPRCICDADDRVPRGGGDEERCDCGVSRLELTWGRGTTDGLRRGFGGGGSREGALRVFDGRGLRGLGGLGFGLGCGLGFGLGCEVEHEFG